MNFRNFLKNLKIFKEIIELWEETRDSILVRDKLSKMNCFRFIKLDKNEFKNSIHLFSGNLRESY
jgi:hypothetical protein